MCNRMESVCAEKELDVAVARKLKALVSMMSDKQRHKLLDEIISEKLGYYPNTEVMVDCIKRLKLYPPDCTYAQEQKAGGR